jgi:hypothetical protein
MSARLIVLAALVGWLALTGPAHGQSLITEAVMSAGLSSDDVAALGTQLRAFGEAPLQLRYYLETAWARGGAGKSDAFGSAYPYGDRVQVIEAYAEWLAGGEALVGARGGRYRVPFGIYSASDHAYNGFVRAPLIRYDGYYALSNNFLEHGVSVIAGIPRLTVETSLGVPADVGAAERRRGLDTVVRVQGTVGTAIVGVSRIRTLPYQSPRFASGHAEFTGVDVRWMKGGVQLRGEWIDGQPFDNTTTTGWYVDAIVHRPAMGRFTALGRVERLDYDTSPQHALHSRRQTAGLHVRVADGLGAQVNLMHHTGLLHQPKRVSLDAGVTYSVRY